MEDPTGGSIIFNGVDIADMKVDINQHRRHMGMVFQHFNLFPHMTILDNMTLAPMKVKGVSKEEAEKKALELLERVGLADRAGAYPIQLSGGQKQRLCIARALLKKPRILILDDSTSAVDTATEAKIRESFTGTLKETTKLIIAQRITSVMEADQIVVMDEGKIVGLGRHQELLADCSAYQEIYYSQMERQVGAS